MNSVRNIFELVGQNYEILESVRRNGTKASDGVVAAAIQRNHQRLCVCVWQWHGAKWHGAKHMPQYD